jgi:hypothetical protein
VVKKSVFAKLPYFLRTGVFAHGVPLTLSENSLNPRSSLFLPTLHPTNTFKQATSSTDTMSKPLPTETLQQIFSSDLAQHHLSPLCLVDRRISEIVKPYIYDSITIQSQKQLEQFRKQAQNENVELVRSARIVGKRDPWEIRSVPELVHYFKNMAGSMLREEKEAGCVKMLIEGDLVDENRKLSFPSS